MAKARTIQIYLPEGNPRGVRIAEITNRTIQTVLIPRAELNYALSRPEINNVGVYFLIGQDENDSKPVVYIGEAEKCGYRLSQHNQSKDFWQYAVVAVSKTKIFTKSHVKYLEWYCIEQAKKAEQYKTENGNAPTKPHISEPVEADLLDNFEDIKILTSTLGFKIFDIVEKTQKTEILYCNRNDIHATGHYSEDGLIVFAGSTARLETLQGCTEVTTRKRNNLIEDGVLKEKDGLYVFQSDYIFNSPSISASVVLGTGTNGWIVWKYENGKTLDQVKRKG